MNKLKEIKLNLFLIIISVFMLISFSVFTGCSSTKLDKVVIYYNEECQMVYWDVVEGASNYIININGEEKQIATSFYILSYENEINLSIKVKAVSDKFLGVYGDYSDTLSVIVEGGKTYSFVGSNDNLNSAEELLDYLNSKIIKSTFKIINNPYYVTDGFIKNTVYGEGKQGSGVIFQKSNNSYYMLTNNHVVSIDDNKYKKQDLLVYDYKGDKVEGKLVYASADFDLAIISFNSSETYSPLNFTTKSISVNDYLISVSTPQGQYNCVSFGRYVGMSLVDTSLTSTNSKINFNVIKHTCLINSGSSGSVLLNLNFEICGINFGRGQSSDNTYTFAVPIEKVNEFIAEANNSGK